MRIRTGSRLHMGFLSLPENTDSERTWGGIGLMLEHPGIELSAEPSQDWHAEGPLSQRVLQFARMVTVAFADKNKSFPLSFRINRGAPEHSGLGTGTQLGLAVARLMLAIYQCPNMPGPSLAKMVGRGKRSALGIHGFDLGGFLVEAGKRPKEEIAPLIHRSAFPENWPILLILPERQQGLHGSAESQAMDKLIKALPTAKLCRLVLQDILPALAAGNYPTFGEAVYEYNRLVGESFRSVQGGVYSHAKSEAVVSFLRREGVLAVGQSSWGPALFSIVNDAMQADTLRLRLCERFAFSDKEVLLTAPKNGPAGVVTTDSDGN